MELLNAEIVLVDYGDLPFKAFKKLFPTYKGNKNKSSITLFEEDFKENNPNKDLWTILLNINPQIANLLNVGDQYSYSADVGKNIGLKNTILTGYDNLESSRLAEIQFLDYFLQFEFSLGIASKEFIIVNENEYNLLFTADIV